MFSGDEEYGDDITSGVFEEEERPSFRAFCENGECTWSSDGTYIEESAQASLEEHTTKKHPGEPIVGAVDEL